LLAYLSYRFIETPFRKRSGAQTDHRKLAELGITIAFISSVCIAILVKDGIPQRVPADAWKLVSARDNESVPRSCKSFSEENELDAFICTIGSSNSAPSFILWGDSHAKAISHAVHLAAAETNRSGILIYSHGCRPLVGVYRKNKPRCRVFNSEVLKYIATQPSLQHIFLAGYWRVPFTGQGYDNSDFLIMDDQTILRSPGENRRVFERGIGRTLSSLKGYNTNVLEDVPEIGSQFGASVGNHFVRQAWLGGTSSDELVFETGTDSFEREFKEMVVGLTYEQQYIEVTPLLCPGGKCPLLSEDKLIYRDGDHLSIYGASLLAPIFLGYFEAGTAARDQPIQSSGDINIQPGTTSR